MSAGALPLGPTMAAQRSRIVGIDQMAPLLGGSMRPYVNLDNAATAPVLRDVLDHVNQCLGWYASVHRGSGFKSQRTTLAYEQAREAVARFVGGRPGEHTVIFGKNATEAINKLSHRLPLTGDDVVLVSLLEHHSNDLPWRARARVAHIGADAQGRLDEDHYEHLLCQHAGRVKLVCVSGGSNVTGVMPPIHRLAVKAHGAGAQILVDAAQLAPHRRIDIGALDDPAHLDFVALSAHKMYAPFGTGALIGRRDVFELGEPEHRGGGTIDFVSTESVDWAAAPERDEAGTPNVLGVLALARAMQELDEIGFDAIAAHEAALCAHALERLSRVDGLRLYGDADPRHAADRLGVVAFNLDRHPHALVAAVLGAEFGIGVRNGCFCAQPYVSHLLGMSRDASQRYRKDIAVGDRSCLPGMVRASFGLYNSFEEIDMLVDALETIAHTDYLQRYEVEASSGSFTPRGHAPAAAASQQDGQPCTL